MCLLIIGNTDFLIAIISFSTLKIPIRDYISIFQMKITKLSKVRYMLKAIQLINNTYRIFICQSVLWQTGIKARVMAS